jgi:hypothetical protein
MDFVNVKSITIAEGEATSISCGDVILWSAGRIPSQYQEVEYVKATDNVGSYINLGFAFDTKAKICLSQIFASVSSSQHGYVFGASENSGKIRCMLSSPYSGSPVAYGSTGTANINAATSLKSNALNEIEIVLEKGNLKITNVTVGTTQTNTSQGEYTMTSNLYLFAQNYNGSLRFGDNRTIKAFKYYDKTNTLICDLVPCYRKADGVIGMYDIVRKIFLTNAGSGTFTKGADV